MVIPSEKHTDPHMVKKICNAEMNSSFFTYVYPLFPSRSDAVSKLKVLLSGRFLERRTVVLKIKFTLFSPAHNLFTTVTMLTEHNPIGVLHPSAEVQSVPLYRTPAVWDYVVMVYQVK